MEIFVTCAISQKTSKPYYGLAVGVVAFFIDPVQAYYLCTKACVDVPVPGGIVKVGELL